MTTLICRGGADASDVLVTVVAAYLVLGRILSSGELFRAFLLS